MSGKRKNLSNDKIPNFIICNLPIVKFIAIFATEYKITTMISNSAVYFWFYYPVLQQEIGK